MWGFILTVTLALSLKCTESAGVGAARLLCYVDEVKLISFSECTHVVYTGVARDEKLDDTLKEFKKLNPRTKVLLRVNDEDLDLKSLTRSKYVQGLEIYNAHQTLNRTKIQETLESARSAIAKSGGGPLYLSLPGHAELLAKYYDLRTLVKIVDLMVLETHDLGKMKRMTYHPSRLSGLWDMMNTDSVVDLAIGLGVPATKIVISLPATAYRFTLENQTLSTPGSPSMDEEPQEIDQAQLCDLIEDGRWTLERDQDLSAPYAFRNKTWIAFEDPSSIDVKGKYARVRGLAGVALQKADRDLESTCGPTLRKALGKVLNQQSRAPRAAVLRSLENEILAAPIHAQSLEALHLSPYRITQVVDSDGVIHSIREDTRTEFSCTRQGYFVHPRSCGRFYRCVKFDQLSPDYTVFEFDCPAGLAFDSRYEVCVWPGSLPHSQACPGSSEIAPVPRTRFHCPEHEGYYADPENCRWFFACLDHGANELSAYEFRCPFGLGFDATRLKCDWPWLVPACGNIAQYEADAFRLSHDATLSGFHGLTADAVNIAGHQSIASGAALDNLVGIQGGFLTQEDSLDNNFIASQELANHGILDQGAIGQGVGLDNLAAGGIGLVQPVNYEKQYTSGSLLLDDYRQPTKVKNTHIVPNIGLAYNTFTAANAEHAQKGNYAASDSGAYIHDASGDHAEPYKHINPPAEPYKHINPPAEPYIHDDQGYKQEYQDYGLYTDNDGKYVDDNSGKYAYNYAEGSKTFRDYNNGNKEEYKSVIASDSGKYVAGVYQTGNSGLYTHVDLNSNSAYSNLDQYNSNYGSSNQQGYITNGNIYTGGSHALTAGAVNVDFVGKTSLVDAEYIAQDNYHSTHTVNNGYNAQKESEHVYQQNYVIPHPAVAINHVGTDFNNHDSYQFATTRTSSGIPTTATPFASTTAYPAVTTFKTTLLPEPPKSSVTEVFGYSKPSLTYVQQALIPVDTYNEKHFYNQADSINQSFASATSNQETHKAESSGYNYPKPSIKFDEGLSYTTPSTIQVPSFQSTEFSHGTKNIIETNSYENLTPIQEEPFKKVIAYTTGPSYAQPTEASNAETYSDQIVHNFGGIHNSYHQQEYNYDHQKTLLPQQTFVSTTSQPQVYNQETLHTVDLSKVQANADQSGYVYDKPAIRFEDASKQIVHVTTEKPIELPQYHSFSQQTLHKIENQHFDYEYSQPSFVEAKPETTVPVQILAQPEDNSYSHRQKTIHKIENQNAGYEYPKPEIHQEIYQPTVHVSTAETPVAAPEYNSYSHSHQTIHKVETQNNGYDYPKPQTYHESYQPIVQVSTVKAPVAAPEYNSFSQSQQIIHKPQIYLPPVQVSPTVSPVAASQYNSFSHSQQTIHKVENQDVGYEYPKPLAYLPPIQVSSTEIPLAAPEYNSYSHSQQTSHGIESHDIGYKYSKPQVYSPAVQVSTAETPTASPEYNSFSHSQHTIHKIENQHVGYEYPKPHVYLPPVQVTTTESPVASPQYKLYSHIEQNIHKDESQNNGYDYPKPHFQVSTIQPPQYNSYSHSHQTVHNTEIQNKYQYEEPVKYKLVQNPTPVKVSTIQPPIAIPEQNLYSQQTVHAQSQNSDFAHHTPEDSGYFYETPKPTVYQKENQGYNYAKPKVQLIETPQPVQRLQTHKTAHEVHHVYQPVTSPPAPEVIYKKPDVTIYDNPILKYTQKQTITYSEPAKAIFTESYPVIKKQEYIPQAVVHKSETDNGNQNLFIYNQPEIQANVETVSTANGYSQANEVSHQYYHQYNTAPSTENYGHQYVEQATQKAPVQEETVIHQTPDQFDYKGVEYAQQYELSHKALSSQVAFTTKHDVPKPAELYSSVKSTSSAPLYQTPEIQIGDKAEEYSAADYSSNGYQASYSSTPGYLPPKADNTYLPPTTIPAPVVKINFKTPEYLPPVQNTYAPSTSRAIVNIEYQARDYLPPKDENEYLPPNTTPKPAVEYTSREYLPPVTTVKPAEYTEREYLPPRKQKTYIPPRTTAQPAVIFTEREYLPPRTTAEPESSTREYLPPRVKNTYLPPSTTYKPKTSTTAKSTTEYMAPEYLPPDNESNDHVVNYESFGTKTNGFDENSNLQYNPYEERVKSSTVATANRNAAQRKHNLVIETAKANLLGFGTVGPDAGLNSEASYSSTPAYSTTLNTISTTTEEYSPKVPARRVRPKVAIVTKINDFNPFLVRKLGAVCSCQQPIVVLRGRRPSQKVEVEYDDEYDYSEREDLELIQKPQRSRKPNKNSIATVTTTTFNPIIVPDDSYYQDYEDISQIKSKSSAYYETSSPAYAETERVVQIKPRVKAISVAPTYKTILSEVSSTAAPAPSASPKYVASVDTSYDRRLQGTIDCQRAGLFRHPKQCNKFYACRWDKTKNRFTLHVFNCPVQLSFDPNLGACNWPSQGPSCQGDTLLTNNV